MKRGWGRKPSQIILTITSIVFLIWAVPPLVNWAFIKAVWRGDSRAVCPEDGACWAFLTDRWHQLLYGFYPEAERWRANLFFLLLAVGIVLLLKGRPRWQRATLLYYVPVAFVLSWWLLSGGLGLPHVDTAQWGGFLLTMVIACVGILCSLPFGILLALGRRSRLPVIKTLSIAFIEFWRGVPLITVLFMASVMLPLFLENAGEGFDKLLRCLIGITLFSSAYMAEVVRGGLQAIPRGQFEAAQSLGLKHVTTLRLIILPQALRHVIPGIVNSFISLFKDTTLVLIVGMFDLLGMVQAATADPRWLGHALEGYVFAGLVYWVVSYGMSRWSRRLEAR